MNLGSYDSNQTLKVFRALGFESIVDNEFTTYLYNRVSNDEVFVDKTTNIGSEIIEKQLRDIHVHEWVFDALYTNLNHN